MIIYRTDVIILREKLRKNPDVLYIFGDNLIRKGLGGQAKEMRGESNAIGIVTKRYPSNSPTSFIHDSDLDINHLKTIVDNDISRVIIALKSGKYRALVIPQLGVGLAKLHINAPNFYKYIQDSLDGIDKELI